MPTAREWLAATGQQYQDEAAVYQAFLRALPDAAAGVPSLSVRPEGERAAVVFNGVQLAIAHWFGPGEHGPASLLQLSAVEPERNTFNFGSRVFFDRAGAVRLDSVTSEPRFVLPRDAAEVLFFLLTGIK